MKYENLDYAVEMLVHLLDEKRIPCHHVQLPFRIMNDIPDNGLRSLLYGKEAPSAEHFPDLFYENDQQVCYGVSDAFQWNWFFLPLPSRDTTLVFGPYIAGTFPASVIRNVRSANGLTERQAETYRQYSMTLPRVYDTVLLESIFKTFCTFLYGEDGFVIHPWQTSPIHTGTLQVTQEKPAFRELEERYVQETQLMNAIRDGDAQRVHVLLAKLSSYGIESRSGSLLRDAKNYSIVFNTLCRISAYRGGVHPEEADTLSRQYSSRIENAVSFAELTKIRDDMIQSYCSAAARDRDSAYSLSVRRAIAYVAVHFQEPVTLAKTADELGITKTWLSAVFRKETGYTFSQYVRRYRLSMAQDLLQSSSLSIDEIASFCGIPEPNYFSRLFRAEYGMSPSQYRSKTT